MTIRAPRNFRRGLTRIELLVIVGSAVLVLLVMLAGVGVLIYARRSGPNARVARIQCVSSLKQVAIAYKLWSTDHGDKLPWQVPAKDDGTLEYVQGREVFRHFLVASNELVSPKILVCPADRERQKVPSWSQFEGHRNLSYIIGVDSDDTKPQTILSGDRNLTGGTMASENILMLPASSAGWGKDIHRGAGNLSLADGSARQTSTLALQKQLEADQIMRGARATRLAVPVIP
jgi:hypothetical protein